MTVVWALLMLAVAVGAIVLARRIEPHWCAPDASRFTCRVQELADTGTARGPWVTGRADVVDGGVRIEASVAGRPAGPEPPRPVLGRAEAPPRGRAVFVVGGSPMLALRVPEGSPAAARLESMVRR